MHVAYHARKKDELLETFGVEALSGLSVEEAADRLQQYGANTLKGKHIDGPLRALARQFKNPLILILVAALVGTLYLNERVNVVVIALAIAVNIIIGFIQEYRAGKAFAALVASEDPLALVRRGGVKRLVKSSSLVPGDIVFLESGDIVPADSYILSALDFSVSEAHLTGESEPIEKQHGVLELSAAIYERTNMVFMGSPALSGSAEALVVATGRNAEVGAIAGSLSEYHKATTPVEVSVASLARFLAIIVLGVIFMLFVVGAMRGDPFTETLLLAIALAVSVVPEGLPAAVTAILAIGMEHILKKRGLVRNLLAAETLGSTTIILTDKTGTLTEASMRVRAIITASSKKTENHALESDQRTVLEHALRVGEVSLVGDKQKEIHGRPLERAIALFAVEAGILHDTLSVRDSRFDFMKFSSARRFAAALYGSGEEKTRTLFASGAAEVLLAHASSYLDQGGVMPLGDEARRAFEEKLALFAEEGKRVIGVLKKPEVVGRISRAHDSTLLDGGIFEGLIVFEDPLRSDVAVAIQEVRGAGVRVVMVTGDTPITAATIAREAGILEGEEDVISGKDIEAMDDDTLADALLSHSVFARILPHQKQRLVEVLTARGEVVGMTGDGVNDAPALKAAAIGVAVGSGTEVAREAAGLVLLGDSFSIIVSAIHEGRRIMDNLKKAVTHLVSTSFHEVFVISVAVFAGLPLPILPVQILWVNMLEEGFLSFAFAFEPAEKDVMRRAPGSESLRTVLTKEVKTLILVAGFITSIFSVALYLWLLSRGLPIEEIRTIMFVVLSLDALLFAVSLKSLHQPFWTVNLRNNRYLLFALGFSALGLFATLEIPFVRELLSLVPPNGFDLAVLIGVAFVNLLTIEFAKKVAFSSRKAAVVQ